MGAQRAFKIPTPQPGRDRIPPPGAPLARSQRPAGARARPVWAARAPQNASYIRPVIVSCPGPSQGHPEATCSALAGR
jgi:hypothetical protein